MAEVQQQIITYTAVVGKRYSHTTDVGVAFGFHSWGFPSNIYRTSKLRLSHILQPDCWDAVLSCRVLHVRGMLLRGVSNCRPARPRSAAGTGRSLHSDVL